MIKYGYIQAGGVTLYATPDSYRVIEVGTKTQSIPTATGVVLDIGYGFLGFEVVVYHQDASVFATLDNATKTALTSGVPMSVQDTIYPGGKTWSGFFQRPIVKAGSVLANGTFGLPDRLMLDGVQLSFVSVDIERL